MVKFLLALKICICLLGITFAYAQNPVIFERRIGIFPDGTERIQSEKYWDRDLEGKIRSSEEKIFSYRDGKQFVLERNLEQFFPDSTHRDQIKSFGHQEAYEGNTYKLRKVETYIPSIERSISVDSNWVYNEDLRPYLSRVRRSEQNHNEFYESESWFNLRTESWEQSYESSWKTEEVLDANGCLVESSFISNGQMTSNTLYTVNERCEVSIRVRRTYDFQRQDWNTDTIFRYVEGDFLVEENSQGSYKQIWELGTDRLIENTRLENGRILRTRINYFLAGDSLISIFDTQSKRVSDTVWQKADWRRKTEVPNRYERNQSYRNWNEEIGKYLNKGEYTIADNERGDRVFTFNISYVFDRDEKLYIPQFILEFYSKYDYNLYCDGELKEKVIYGNEWNSGLLRKMSRVEYGYLHPSECGETSDLLQVYPNPVSPDGILTITREAFSGAAGARLTDLQGRVIKSIPMIGRSPLVQISLNGITPGLYLLQVEVEGVWGMVEKLMVR